MQSSERSGKKENYEYTLKLIISELNLYLKIIIKNKPNIK